MTVSVITSVAGHLMSGDSLKSKIIAARKIASDAFMKNAPIVAVSPPINPDIIQGTLSCFGTRMVVGSGSLARLPV